jgi:hypothetical protein
MTSEEIRRLVAQLTSNTTIERMAARLAFLKMDEGAVQPLADELYSGVNEVTGMAILELMGEIGGWEAISVLQDIYFAESSRPELSKVAAQGLRNNGREDLLRS